MKNDRLKYEREKHERRIKAYLDGPHYEERLEGLRNLTKNTPHFFAGPPILSAEEVEVIFLRLEGWKYGELGERFGKDRRALARRCEAVFKLLADLVDRLTDRFTAAEGAVVSGDALASYSAPTDLRGAFNRLGGRMRAAYVGRGPRDSVDIAQSIARMGTRIDGGETPDPARDKALLGFIRKELPPHEATLFQAYLEGTPIDSRDFGALLGGTVRDESEMIKEAFLAHVLGLETRFGYIYQATRQAVREAA